MMATSSPPRVYLRLWVWWVTPSRIMLPWVFHVHAVPKTPPSDKDVQPQVPVRRKQLPALNLVRNAKLLERVEK